MTYTLGIDSSTQSIKALVYEVETRRVVTTVSVNFGKELREYNCPDGFLPNDNVLVRQVYSAFVSLKLGMDILSREGVTVDSLMGHGGIFKDKGIAQAWQERLLRTKLTSRRKRSWL